MMNSTLPPQSRHDTIYDITELREKYQHVPNVAKHFNKDLFIRRIIPLYVSNRISTAVAPYGNVKALLTVSACITDILIRSVPVTILDDPRPAISIAVQRLIKMLDMYFSNPRRNFYTVPEGPYDMTPIELPLGNELQAVYMLPNVTRREKNDPHQFMIMGKPHYFMSIFCIKDLYVY